MGGWFCRPLSSDNVPMNSHHKIRRPTKNDSWLATGVCAYCPGTRRRRQDCLGDIIEVVSHSRKKCVSGGGMRVNLVDEGMDVWLDAWMDREGGGEACLKSWPEDCIAKDREVIYGCCLLSHMYSLSLLYCPSGQRRQMRRSTSPGWRFQHERFIFT